MNYDELRERHTKIHFFGLGFIQIKLGETERVHLYHPNLSAFVPPEEIHNHRYDFTSEVLKGCFEQVIYELDFDGGGATIREVSCDLKVPASDATSKVGVRELTRMKLRAGTEYTLTRDAFHRVLPATVPTITRLNRGEKKSAFASVVSTSEERICPFSRDLSKDELWEWVRKIIE